MSVFTTRFARRRPASRVYDDQPNLAAEHLAAKAAQAAAEERRQAAERERQFEERRQREENWARWNAQVNAAKERKAVEDAKRAAEEAAKPKRVIDYLTAAGQALGDRALAVEVVTQPGYNTSDDHTETVATCKACGESKTVRWNGDYWHSNSEYDEGGKLSTSRACKWAQGHAKTCSAMPALN